MNFWKLFIFVFTLSHFSIHATETELPLYYWREPAWSNFGDILSVKVVERIVGQPIRIYKKSSLEKKLLAIGSIFFFANEGDVVWGSGINGKKVQKEDYTFSSLDVRSVRGPLTRQFLTENFNIAIPEIYGDPALLIPYLFPEFKKKENPKLEYIIIPHYLDEKYFEDSEYENVVSSRDDWREIIEKILDSRFVISSSLHGVIVAEAFGIPARLLRISEREPIFKFLDYYLGTNRSECNFARSVEEALQMGGEPFPLCDLEKLYNAFPFDYWPNADFYKPKFPNFSHFLGAIHEEMDLP